MESEKEKPLPSPSQDNELEMEKIFRGRVASSNANDEHPILSKTNTGSSDSLDGTLIADALSKPRSHTFAGTTVTDNSFFNEGFEESDTDQSAGSSRRASLARNVLSLGDLELKSEMKLRSSLSLRRDGGLMAVNAEVGEKLAMYPMLLSNSNENGNCECDEENSESTSGAETEQGVDAGHVEVEKENDVEQLRCGWCSWRPDFIQKVPGLLSRRPFRIKVVLTVAVCTMLVHADASPIGETEHPLTLTAGKDGTIPFKCSNDHQSDGEKYYSVQFEGKDRPFYANGDLDPEGLVSPDQVQRFSVVYVEDDSGISIEIHIESVSEQDQGTYIFVTVTIIDDQHEFEKRKIEVRIHIPPGPAACFIEPSINMRDELEIHCHSKPGNGNGTLTCFQKGEKIPYIGKRGIVHRRSFWLLHANVLVSCCSHEFKDKDTITEDMCKQYTWPRNNIINNPLPTEKVPSKIAPVSRPNLSNDDDIIPPRTHATVHSGSAKSYQVWQKAMLSLMAIVAYASACTCNI